MKKCVFACVLELRKFKEREGRWDEEDGVVDEDNKERESSY